MAKIIKSEAKKPGDKRQQLLDQYHIDIIASDFSSEQLEIIFEGARAGIDASIYANKAHSPTIMQEILTLMQNCQKTSNITS